MERAQPTATAAVKIDESSTPAETFQHNQVQCNLSSRRVTFTTATTYTFSVSYGGSAVPKTTGPPIGLAPTHTSSTSIDLSKSKLCRRGSVRKFNHLERIGLLKEAQYHVQDIAAFCVEALAIRKSRADTVNEVRAEKNATKRMHDGHLEDDVRVPHRSVRPRMWSGSAEVAAEA
ncbi:hypothetical protein H310_12195 [Aphanomyces invadans]|uniref:Cysteine/serine-rich nuclear protein N-terminal domain-containing protein n=1 Tax=Aphanomyces invadans TaxID=157072 RepID=A0A024TIG1_9STRA|nr:hypothetical protein H310_12195 [Aphanomyces invadans]ETV93843.1 hypothetical protein H310_12195 [Aphanomyces invadans]|eukprot:XP_008877403.1 hypothetical protein H310_12195 [Aphanomyces invadans]